MMRLDVWLVEAGKAASRSRAQHLIRSGKVSVNGEICIKPALPVESSLNIEVEESPDDRWVSRGALKLLHAMEVFQPKIAGKTCIDIGASTGGFTQVLLENDAELVYAVDVGSGQLHPEIAKHFSVIALENINARYLEETFLPNTFDVVVVDVSFISLLLVLPSVFALVKPEAQLIALIKPQFEVGREGVGKNGIVTLESLQQKAVEKIRDWVSKQSGWQVQGVIPSPVRGSDGNQEYLLYARKS
jgi:23S rRNA (cytidine1920-2'-O)/16S rRNA (cytidine1409-2'-O)-methyltransferase